MQGYVNRKRDEMLAGFLGRINDQFSEGNEQDFSAYKGRPVAFIEEVFHETLTDDQITLANAVQEHGFTVAMSGNATGKSMLAARLALYYFLVYTVGCEVYLVATSEQQLKRVLWKEVSIVVDRFPDLFKHATIQSKQISCGPARTVSAVIIPLTGTESQIEGKLSGSHVSGQEGDIVQIYILDEADSLPNAGAVWRAIESCLSGPGAKAAALFNPRHPVGPLQTMVQRGTGHVVTLTELAHPNVIDGPDTNGKDPVPGAITQAKVIQRSHAWTRPLTDQETPDSTCFELPEYLSGVEGVKDRAGKILPPLTPGWRKITSPEFDYMVLARFPGQGHRQLVNMEWINDARTRYDALAAQMGGVIQPPSHTTGIAGLDVAEYGQDANALILRYGGLVLPVITWAGIDVIATAARAAAEIEGKSINRVCVDATGIGSGTAPAMRRHHNAHAVGVHFGGRPTKSCELGDFANLKAELYFEVREALRTGTMLLPPDEMLIQELLAYSYDVDDKGKVTVTKKSVIRELIKRSSDRADSLALSYHKGELLFPNL